MHTILPLTFLTFISTTFSSPTALNARSGGQVITKCTVANTVALTFDDGPFNYTSSIIDALDDVGAKGTFFFNGNNYDCIYDEDSVSRVRRAVERGHQVASHTWAHPDLTDLNRDEVDTQFSMINNALLMIAGVYPAFMRPPYGEYNDLVVDVARQQGQAIVLWDFDSGDSIGISATDSESLYDGLAKKRPKTILTLNHETQGTTAQVVLPHAIRALQKVGYRLVTVAECLGQQPYLSVISASSRNNSWMCG